MRSLSALALLWLCAFTSATEYHVSTTGNDGNDGSAQRPFRTVQFAAARAGW